MSTSSYYEKRKLIKKKRVKHLHKIKTSKGCETCGYNENGYALVFAHRDPMTKNKKCVGQGKGGSGMNGLTKQICVVGARKDSSEKNRGYIKELFEEIRKCKILCMNCHTIETMLAGEHENCVETFNARKHD
tara:strand:- start:294 stop:689 length:396 start_codon:yes stop_codon:yes gene_type:complete